MARAEAIWRRLRKSRDNPEWEDVSERSYRDEWSGSEPIEGELADVVDVDERAARGEAYAAAEEGDVREFSVDDWARRQRAVFSPRETSNCLLSFGFPGSGKTTFQSFLAYYLTHVGPFDASPKVDPLSRSEGWSPMVAFNEWVRLWQRGQFPPANPVDEGDIREMAFHVRPLEGQQVPLDFSFLEISGELMARVIAARDRDPDLVERVTELFGDEQIHLLLVFVIDPDHGDENDILFQNLVSFLDVYFPGARERMSVAIMISKPEASLQRLQARYPGFQSHTQMRGQLCEEYVKRMAPRTHRILDSWPKQDRVQLMTLRLGEFDGNSAEPRLNRASYTDIEAIFGWIYTQFTGARLGPGYWKLLLDWLKR